MASVSLTSFLCIFIVLCVVLRIRSTCDQTMAAQKTSSLSALVTYFLSSTASRLVERENLLRECLPATTAGSAEPTGTKVLNSESWQGMYLNKLAHQPRQTIGKKSKVARGTWFGLLRRRISIRGYHGQKTYLYKRIDQAHGFSKTLLSIFKKYGELCMAYTVELIRRARLARVVYLDSKTRLHGIIIRHRFSTLPSLDGT